MPYYSYGILIIALVLLGQKCKSQAYSTMSYSRSLIPSKRKVQLHYALCNCAYVALKTLKTRHVLSSKY